MRNIEGINYEIYYPYNKSLDKPVISISKRGFSFNKYCKKFFWKKPYARLYYCRDKKIIAIEPYHLDTEHTLHVSRLNVNGNTPLIECKRFLIENDILAFLKLDISEKKSERFMVEWDEKNLCFLIHLNSRDGK